MKECICYSMKTLREAYEERKGKAPKVSRESTMIALHRRLRAEHFQGNTLLTRQTPHVKTANKTNPQGNPTIAFNLMVFFAI